MKLRIRGDSLRLRLTRSEVAALATDGRVQATMHALGGALRYAVQTRPDAELGAELSRDGDATVVTVTLDRQAVAGWAESDQVGFEGHQDLGDGTKLALLIEKDFACLVPRGDQDDDAYTNPAASA